MMLQIVEYLVKRETHFLAFGLEMINHNVMADPHESQLIWNVDGIIFG